MWRKGGQWSQPVGSPTLTDRQTQHTRTEQCWDPLFPALSLSSETLIDSQTCCRCSLGDPQCVSLGAGPQRERCVPLTQQHPSSPRPGPPPAFLSILQWTPCAHHSSPGESTVHVGTPPPGEPQDVGGSSRDSSTPGYSRLVPLGASLLPGVPFSSCPCGSATPPTHLPLRSRGACAHSHAASQHRGSHRTTAMPATLRARPSYGRMLGTDGVHTPGCTRMEGCRLAPCPFSPITALLQL